MSANYIILVMSMPIVRIHWELSLVFVRLVSMEMGTNVKVLNQTIQIPYK